jgi:hypothetical protein
VLLGPSGIEIRPQRLVGDVATGTIELPLSNTTSTAASPTVTPETFRTCPQSTTGLASGLVAPYRRGRCSHAT